MATVPPVSPPSGNVQRTRWARPNQARPAELPGFGLHLDLLPFFNEEGNANFQACLQFGGLGHAAARGVATDAGFGIRDRQFHLGRQL